MAWHNIPPDRSPLTINHWDSSFIKCPRWSDPLVTHKRFSNLKSDIDRALRPAAASLSFAGASERIHARCLTPPPAAECKHACKHFYVRALKWRNSSDRPDSVRSQGTVYCFVCLTADTDCWVWHFILGSFISGLSSGVFPVCCSEHYSSSFNTNTNVHIFRCWLHFIGSRFVAKVVLKTCKPLNIQAPISLPYAVPYVSSRSLRSNKHLILVVLLSTLINRGDKVLFLSFSW